jgi:EmrB/QacA subfamily drug resistance transporter
LCALRTVQQGQSVMNAQTLPRASAHTGGELEVVAAVALSAMLAPLNSTMIAVALPHLTIDLGTDAFASAWLVTTYLIIMAALQPVAGTLGDRFGRRSLMLGGVAAFGLASLGAACATSLPALIALRALQAVAGALAFPNGVALLRERIPVERRAGRSGMVGAAVAGAAAVGPALGGLLVGLAGWRAIFVANLVLVIPALLLGWHAIPVDSAQRTRRPFDLAGALLLALLLVGVVALLMPGQYGWRTIWVGSAGLMLGLVLFIWYEARQPDPALQPRLFRHPAFAAANAAVGLSNLAMYVILLVLPVYLGQRAGWNSAQIGLALALLSAGSVGLAPIGGRLADRFGRRWPTVGGMALLALGLLPLALGGASFAGLLLGGRALAGAGLGLTAAGLQISAVEAAARGESGMAAGVFSTSRYLGSIVGSSLLGRMLAPSGGGFDAVFALACGAALAAMLSALTLADHPARDG